MSYLRRFFDACAVLSILAFQTACLTTEDSSTNPLELVESFPSETSLGHAHLPKTADAWMKLITEAETSLDLSFFYIANEAGDALEPILQALEQAARRGVRLRVLLDRVFLERYPDTMGRDAERVAQWPNTEVRRVRRWAKVNGIQHNKYLLADRKRAYLGSANLDWRALVHIQEYGYVFASPSLVRPLQAVFDEDWTKAESDDPSQNLQSEDFEVMRWTSASGEANAAFLRVSPAPAANAEAIHDLPVLLRWIDEARDEVVISAKSYTTKFYGRTSTWTGIEERLVQARQRGVKIRFLLENTRHPDVFVPLLRHGVEISTARIPQHSSGPIPFARMVHAKFMVFDQKRLWLGTGNITPDSFLDSRNVSIFVESVSYARQLQETFETYWRSEFREIVPPP